MDRFVIISGCSGGGKSTLLEELRLRDYPCVEEPGRRIVARELDRGGVALPWADRAAFARQAVELSSMDRVAAERWPCWVSFDRGLIDASVALQHLTGEPVVDELRHAHRYNKHVFLTPPWPEIYKTDNERRHSFAEAVAEYDRLRTVYPSLGYEVTILPKIDVGRRADYILAVLNAE